MDTVDEEGRWHCVVVGEEVFKQVLLDPSIAYTEKNKEAVATAEAEGNKERDRMETLKKLREKRSAGQKLTEKEKDLFLDYVLGF